MGVVFVLMTAFLKVSNYIKYLQCTSPLLVIQIRYQFVLNFISSFYKFWPQICSLLYTVDVSGKMHCICTLNNTTVAVLVPRSFQRPVTYSYSVHFLKNVSLQSETSYSNLAGCQYANCIEDFEIIFYGVLLILLFPVLLLFLLLLLKLYDVLHISGLKMEAVRSSKAFVFI